MKTRNLNSLTSDDLESILGADPIVSLVGSGISTYEPTDLPAGQSVTSAVLQVLSNLPGASDQDEADQRQLDKLLAMIPFEALMERCPSPQKVRGIIFTLYGGGREPNGIHHSIAQLALNKRINSIITTNYDLALDEALRCAGAGLPLVVRDTDAPVGERAYFKIHGTASPNHEDTLVYSLRLEAAMPPWKRNLLEKLIHGRVFLVVGYSGFDFEVCPQIPKAKPHSVIWNFFEEKDMQTSPGYKRLVADGVAVIPLIGNVWTLLELLRCNETETGRHRSTANVEHMLRSSFSKEELILWRINLLNSMGNGRLSLRTLKATDNGPASYDRLRAYAESEHHRGQYRNAEKFYLRASKIAPDDLSRRMCLLDASDEARCFGHWRRAEKLIDFAIERLPHSMSKLDRNGLRARELLKRTLVLGQWIQTTSKLARLTTKVDKKDKLGLERRTKTSQAQAAEWISEGSGLAIVNGLWFDFQQYRLWAERMSLSASLVMSRGPFEPPPSREGYQQLGYSLALLMVNRDQAKREARSGSRTDRMADELEQSLIVADHLGCHPEIWKLAHTLITLFRQRQVRYFRKLLWNFLLCQYAPTKRIPYLILGA